MMPIQAAHQAHSSLVPQNVNASLVDPQWRTEVALEQLRQQVAELQQQVRFLKGACGAMFDNENRLAKWVYFAHPNIPNQGQLFTRLKPYQPYQISETYPFQPTLVYGCSS
jgi:hypothetical protein